jgi:hypothetical protein
MSVGKTVGVVTILGGTALIGYYFLEKNKPTIADTQLTQLQSEIKSTATAVYTPAEKTPLELFQIRYAKMTPLERAKLSESDLARYGFADLKLDTKSTTDTKELLSNYAQTAYGQEQRVKLEFPLPDAKTDSYGLNDCKALDVTKRNIVLKSAEEAQKILNGNGSQIYFNAMKEREKIINDAYISNQCAVQFGKARLDETGALITEGAIKTERSILGISTIDENIYLKLGAGVLLIGLFVVLKTKD